MKLVNLTPHTVTVCGVVVRPSSVIARVAMLEEVVGIWPVCRMHDPMGEECRRGGGECEGLLAEIPVLALRPGRVEGLPPPEVGTLFIVSALVAGAVEGRPDVVSPARLIRDEAGRVVGAAALARGGLS